MKNLILVILVILMSLFMWSTASAYGKWQAYWDCINSGGASNICGKLLN